MANTLRAYNVSKIEARVSMKLTVGIHVLQSMDGYDYVIWSSITFHKPQQNLSIYKNNHLLHYRFNFYLNKNMYLL